MKVINMMASLFTPFFPFFHFFSFLFFKFPFPPFPSFPSARGQCGHPNRTHAGGFREWKWVRERVEGSLLLRVACSCFCRSEGGGRRYLAVRPKKREEPEEESRRECSLLFMLRRSIWFLSSCLIIQIVLKVRDVKVRVKYVVDLER